MSVDFERARVDHFTEHAATVRVASDALQTDGRWVLVQVLKSVYGTGCYGDRLQKTRGMLTRVKKYYG